MKTNKLGRLWITAIALFSTLSAHARPDGIPGRWDYLDNCASCHGVSARGDGPLVRHLVTAPSDLTLLAQRNGGVFPRAKVIAIIDGRAQEDSGPHGSREMPIWGQAFTEDACPAEDCRCAAEEHTRRRILELVRFLERQQR